VADDLFERAVAGIDDANADDPNTIVARGETRPKEQAHAELMTEWVRRLDPDATDAQLLAARAHHLRRWTVPRATFPEGRAGYLRWRTTLKKQHGEDVARILGDVGYDADSVARVVQIVRKENLRIDPAVQTHEDALCLVFLETQLTELIEQLGDEKAVDVVRKTVAKMSDRAISIAAGLPMTDGDRRVVERATTTAT